MNLKAIRSWEPYARSLLRIVAGFTFSLHGYAKMFGVLGGLGGTGAKPPFPSLLWTAGALETVGGALIILGPFTTPTAFILCGEMAVGYFVRHFPKGHWPLTNGGELAVLYCFLYLYLFTAGPGAWSLDNLLRKKSP
ncbi:MAG TPA: DoxX family protein [Candidatus Acidoferrum sp.]|nr:DoxX family protein [Candidatus Acidoferrum sp.]